MLLNSLFGEAELPYSKKNYYKENKPQIKMRFWTLNQVHLFWDSFFAYYRHFNRRIKFLNIHK